ncbi:MAG TPA: GH116 family glycosyl hydrolase [Gemmatimonadales bacterium]|nr:GH116 family glycosyl hydrolase [Gemmatimonadales bacterium]
MKRWVLVAGGPDGDAAFGWLESLPDVEARRADALEGARLEQADGVWVHGPVAPARGVVEWLRGGGRMLCTLEAALLPSALGLEAVAPDDRSDTPWPSIPPIGPLPPRLGLACFGPHPLLDGLGRAAFTWAPAPGDRLRRTAYHATRPAASRIVAVERSGTVPDPARTVAWEQDVGAGGVLCIGAFVVPDAADPLCRPQLEAVLANAILGEAIPHEGRSATAAAWPAPGLRAVEEPAMAVPSLPALGPSLPSSSSPLRLEGPATDAAWTLAGRRLVALGREDAGLVEAWAHPVRLLAGVHWEAEVVPGSVAAAPEAIDREGRVGGATVRERWHVPVELPALIWEVEGAAGQSLAFTVDLRRAWPAPPGAGGDLRFAVRPDGGAVWVCDGAGARALVAIEGGRLAVRAGHGPAVEVIARPGDAARIVAVAGVDEPDLARGLAGLARRGLAGLAAQRQQHAEQLRRHGTALRCPDDRLTTALEWAKVRMDAHLAGTPGVGRSILAGYAAPDPARPGRTWYHGPDACWTALGMLATGERDGPRDLLKFLAQSQDATGRVPHRVSTSGFADFDAADATPLFLYLAGRYAAWTGDVEFLRRWWPSLLRAYRHCLTCDRDGDGLIENHRQGHDWLRRGPVAALGLSFHLAGGWVAALEGLEPVAEALGFSDLASELADRALAAREVATRRFRSAEGWGTAIDPAGVLDSRATALVAIPVLLGLVLPGEAGAWLDRVESGGFTTPWGVRLLERADPRFDPADVHAGAVSPVLTGWVSLAEWRAGRPEAALAHARLNAALPFERTRGGFDEALDGLERQAAGTCPDHAAAAALTAQPLIEGLWGIVPDALAGTVRVSPWLPPEWDAMALDRLRVGRTSLTLEARRRPGGHVVRVRRTYGPRIHVALGRVGAPPAALSVDDVPLGGAVARFDAEGEHEVIFHDA